MFNMYFEIVSLKSLNSHLQPECIQSDKRNCISPNLHVNNNVAIIDS